MLDRGQVETILVRRFPGASLGQIAAATNSIMGLCSEWEEVRPLHGPVSHHDVLRECQDACYLAQEFDQSGELRLFRRRPSPSGPSVRFGMEPRRSSPVAGYEEDVRADK